MATWVTHLMVADKVLEEMPELDRRGFCVGNIAPDCNVENEDWTSYTPPREVTHWMRGERKSLADCDAFCNTYILERKGQICSREQYAFLLGYYAHLLTDAAFQAMIRNEKRVRDLWTRIKSDACLAEKAHGYPEDFDTVKAIIPKEERLREINAVEAEYLREHPDSGYFTEILPLKEFPDYIDYLPPGCIVRKIGVMGYMPEGQEDGYTPVVISREEYRAFVEDTTALVIGKFRELKISEERMGIG